MIGTNGHGIEELRRRFVDRRRTRVRGTRIPEALCQPAVEAARERGVHRISKQLGVDYYSLARRMNAKSSTTPCGLEFVEFPGRVFSTAPACVVEMQDRQGHRPRVELRDGEDPESLARSIWKSRR